MTDDVNNGIQAEQSLPSRDESSHGGSEGASSKSSEDSGSGPGSGELDRSGDGSEIFDGDIQDDAESYDPGQEITPKTQSFTYSHKGPLPDPQQLAAYARAGETFPERIVKMAEDQVASRTQSMTRLSKADAFATYAGMVTVAGLSLLGLIGAFVGGVMMDKPGAFALVGLPLLTVFPKIIDAIKGNGSSE